MSAIYAFKFGKRGAWRLMVYVGLSVMLLLVLVPAPRVYGQESPSPDQHQDGANSTPIEGESWSLHVQSTVVGQGHPSFAAEYTGSNSLTTGAAVRDTVSVDVIGGARLWRGGEFFGDVLM